MGPPSCGNTTLAKTLERQWERSQSGKSFGVKIASANDMGPKRMVKEFDRLIRNRMCAIIDGGCYNVKMRKPFFEKLLNKNAAVLCIDINCGINMARVLNHACVEDSNDENIILYPERAYHIYKAYYKPPSNSKNLKHVIYYPTIIKRKSVMTFRY
jgi:hypothetical protein